MHKEEARFLCKTEMLCRRMHGLALVTGRMPLKLPQFTSGVKKTNNSFRESSNSLRSTLASSRTYEDALDILNHLEFPGRLTRSRNRDHYIFIKYLERLGYDVAELDSLNVIHVAGTKGKGSVCAFTESILRRCTIKASNTETSRKVITGSFTSPHLTSPVERIKIGGKSISKEEFSRLFFYIWDKLHEYSNPSEDIPVTPTYFKYVFLIAIQKFFEEKVDAAIIEVGLGGEYDVTNVLKSPVVCAITLIGYDHEHILGSNLGEIAWQKAGIFKPHTRALTITQRPEAASVIERRAIEARVQSYRVVRRSHIDHNLELGIKGDHQYSNAALAIKVARSWCDHFNNSNTQYRVEITNDLVSEGLRLTNWQGRTQKLKLKGYENITWYIDGAHNLESLQASVNWFEKEMAAINSVESSIYKCLIFNLTGGRTLQKVAGSLIRYHKVNPFNKVIFSSNNVFEPEENTIIQEESANTWKQLANVEGTQIQVAKSVSNAVKAALEFPNDGVSKPSQGVILVTGSLYLVGGLMECLGINID